MRIAAIICEYNPLHNGHKYHIESTRMLTNCDYLLCVMSGNFVQRGEPSVLDKYSRARHAIMAGADLVIELPPIFALSSAQYFAAGAIKILAKLKEVTHLSFGSEIGNIDDLLKAIEITATPNYNNIFRKHISSGMSYPKASEAAYFELTKQQTPLINPNNLLGMEYIKSIQSIAPNITPVTIARLGAAYHDNNIKVESYSSATAIRASLAQATLSPDGIPDYVYNDLTNHSKIDTNRIFSIVAEKLYNMNKEQLNNLYEGDEGLANRLKNSIDSSTDYNSLLTLTHTKRYTKSKIARLICHALLNHTKIMANCETPLVPLAVNKNNTDLLGIIPKHEDNNIIAQNINYADTIYSIIMGEKKQRNHIEIV